MHRRTARPAVVACALVLTGLLAACGGDGSTSAGQSTDVAETSAPSPVPTVTDPAGTPTSDATTPAADPAPTDGGDPGVPTTQDDVVVEGLEGATRTAVLDEVRTGAHEGYDRVVLQLDGPVSGYVVRYVDELTADPEGGPVEHGGDAALQVVLMGATLDTAFQGDTRRYEGPATLDAGLGAVKDVVQAGDFEATLSLGIGVARRAPFSVQYLEDPARLVVDVAS